MMDYKYIRSNILEKGNWTFIPIIIKIEKLHRVAKMLEKINKNETILYV